MYLAPGKIQIRQWFVTNDSNICCLATTMHSDHTQDTDSVTIFILDLNFARYRDYTSSYMPSSP